MFDSLQPHGLQCVRLPCPSPTSEACCPFWDPFLIPYCCFTVQFSHSVVSNSLRPHGLQQARLPCPSPTPEACSNSCPLSRWCHLTVSSSVVPFSSCIQSFPASGSFLIGHILFYFVLFFFFFLIYSITHLGVLWLSTISHSDISFMSSGQIIILVAAIFPRASVNIC